MLVRSSRAVVSGILSSLTQSEPLTVDSDPSPKGSSGGPIALV